ncbi:Protein big1 [Fusarium austroafricanum]|uniref:Protein BIG1 n=1 Tax=Fusarium austroafricanum TaxID=2364996 RepID=A0A8H4KQ50_9HYPO|nr:Protein big1 [Fusarium austroafricanum]
MRLQIIASALALSGSAAAFSDSWPLVMFSTSQYDARPVFSWSSLLNDDDDRFSDAPSNNHIQTRNQALEQVKDLLTSCPTDNYILIAQEGVNAADLRQPNNLHEAIARKEVKGKFIVPEVVGESIDADAIQDYIKTACYEQAKKVKPHFTFIKASKDEKEVTKKWESNEQWMKDSYTVLFVGTPSTKAKTPISKTVSEPEKTIYESEFIEPLHMDLKRDVSDKPAGNTTYDSRPLFQKYQFFTPGIFMGLIIAIVLFSLLGVGLRALASLEVSYGSFEKDMGPAAQKKQQ